MTGVGGADSLFGSAFTLTQILSWNDVDLMKLQLRDGTTECHVRQLG